MSLHLIREEPMLLEETPQPRRGWGRRVLWLLLGIAVLLLGGQVFSAMCAGNQHVLGATATILIWLQALSCFIRAYRSVH